MKLAVLFSLFAAAVAIQVASANAKDRMNAVLSDDAKTLAYSPCAEDEAEECISYVIHCRGDAGWGSGLAMTLFGAEKDPDVRKLAKILIDKPFGEAKVGFDAGAKHVDATVLAITVNKDEMNGDWDLALHFDDADQFLEALTDTTAKKAKANVAGYTVVLSNDERTAGKLLKLRQGCLGNAQ